MAEKACAIETLFAETFAIDVPPFARKCACDFIEKAIVSNHDAFISIDKSNNLSGGMGPALVASFDMSAVRPFVERAMLSGRSVGSEGFTMEVNDYVAITTISILYHRMLHEMPSSSMMQQKAAAAPNGIDGFDKDGFLQNTVTLSPAAALSYVLCCLEESIANSHHSMSLASVLLDFRKIERSILSNRAVPAFECLRLGGSFLDFIINMIYLPDGVVSQSWLLRGEASALKDRVAAVSRDLDRVLCQSLIKQLGQRNTSEALAVEIDETVSGSSIRSLEEAYSVVMDCFCGIVRRMEFSLSSASSTSASDDSPSAVLASILFDVDKQSTVELGVNFLNGTGHSFLSLIRGALADNDVLQHQLDAILQGMKVQTHQWTGVVCAGESLQKDAGAMPILFGSNSLARYFVRWYFYSRSDATTSFADMASVISFVAEILRELWLMNTTSSSDHIPAEAFTPAASDAVRELTDDQILQCTSVSNEICVVKSAIDLSNISQSFHRCGGGGSTQATTRDSARTDEPILVFPLPVAAVAQRVDTVKMMASQSTCGSYELLAWAALRSKLLHLLKSTPLGVSCLEYSLWQECDYSSLWKACHSDTCDSGEDDPPAHGYSLLDFVLLEQQALRQERPDVVFYVFRDDCIPLPLLCCEAGHPVVAVPAVIENKNDIDIRDTQMGGKQASAGNRLSSMQLFIIAWEAKNYNEAAAFCLSFCLGLVQQNKKLDATSESTVLSEFRQGFHSYLLQRYEQLGRIAMDQLMGDLLQVSFALPSTSSPSASRVEGGSVSADNRYCILQVCLDAMSHAAGIKFESVQQVAIEFAQKNRSAVSGGCILRQLIGAGISHPYAFTTLGQFAKSWVRNVTAVGIVGSTTYLSATASSEEWQLQPAKESTRTGVAMSNATRAVEADGDFSETILSAGAAVTSIDLAAMAQSNLHEALDTDDESADESTDEKNQFVLQLLQNDFHYKSDADGNLIRPPSESPEGRKLQKALDLLSDNLYSSNVHFVMELIQNTDDNSYKSGVVPTVKLKLFDHAILVYNNEVGFTRDNIVAVSNVGGSTKSHRTGYIGQKGIGCAIL